MEPLNKTTPQEIVDFLRQHEDIPSRFQDPTSASGDKTPLVAEIRDQFPGLPIRAKPGWPNPRNRKLTIKELVDVFVIARTWYQYAQIPLPDPDPHPGVDARFIPSGQAAKPRFDPLRHRRPSKMMTILFRTYPARAQAYVAETLQSEGWFDQGWDVNDFDTDLAKQEKWFGKHQSLIIGNDPLLYFSKIPYEKAFAMYLQFAVKNGLYFGDETQDKYQKLATAYKNLVQSKGFNDNVPSPQIFQTPPRGWTREKLKTAFFATVKLSEAEGFRHLSNFDVHFNLLTVEKQPYTIHVRRLFFEAEKLKQNNRYTEAVKKYAQAIPFWRHILLSNPAFLDVQEVQDYAFTQSLKYLRRVQDEDETMLVQLMHAMPVLRTMPMRSPVDLGLLYSFYQFDNHTVQVANELNKILRTTGAKLMANSPIPFPHDSYVISKYYPFDERYDKKKMFRIIPIRQIRGPYDMLLVCNSPHLNKLRTALLGLTETICRPLPIVCPDQFNFTLTVLDFPNRSYNRKWSPMIRLGVVGTVRQQMGLDRKEYKVPDVPTEN